jgi:hypothetical protein
MSTGPSISLENSQKQYRSYAKIMAQAPINSQQTYDREVASPPLFYSPKKSLLMERLDQAQSMYFTPLIIWADDLTDILDVIKDCSRVKFVVDNVSYDSVEEFIGDKNGQKCSELKITGQEPYVTIDLLPRDVRLYVGSSTVLASGLFTTLRGILSRCERKPKALHKLALPTVLVWIIPFTLSRIDLLSPYDYLSPWFVALIIAWILYAGFISLTRYSVIQPFFRRSVPNFIRRNSDAIAVGAISALLGALGGRRQ